MNTPRTLYKDDQKKLYNIVKGTGSLVNISNVYSSSMDESRMCVHIYDKNTDLSCEHLDILALGYIMNGFKVTGNQTVIWFRKFRP